MPDHITGADAAQVLRKALAKLRGGEGWTQHVLARSAKGSEVYPDRRAATCFCATGALRAAAPKDNFRSYQLRECAEALLLAALPHGDWESVEEYNDFEGRTFEEIENLFEQAIAIAEGATA